MAVESFSGPQLQRRNGHARDFWLFKFFAVVTLVAVLSIWFLFPHSSVPSLFSVIGAATDPPLQQLPQDVREEGCDLFAGEWVPSSSGPAYTNATCRFIEDHQNCLRNGRPDTGYLFWRWKPSGCDLPPFDAAKFLGAIRNRTFALIGDSILRNHAQSLICLLSLAEEPVEVYHSDDFKSRRWLFPAHNVSVSLIWTPFLAKADVFEDENGVATSDIQLHLDVLDQNWVDPYGSFDYVIFSGGQWFLKTAIYWKNGAVVGCHYCRNKKLRELGADYAYQKILDLVFKHIADRSSSAGSKPRAVIFRTWTPDHFENGEWYAGGICNRTEPYREGQYHGKHMDHVMRRIELESYNKAVRRSRLNGSQWILLDTYHLSLLRPDGHAAAYRMPRHGNPAAVQQDCLHWCVPGPIDAWNDIIMHLILNAP